MLKKITIILLAFLLFTTPVFSQNTDNKNATNKENTATLKEPIFSPWATFDINEAIYIGLIDDNNFANFDFTKDVSLDFAKKVYKNSREKLEKNNIDVSKDFDFKLLTKEETLKSIASLLKLNGEPIKSLRDEKIFMGTGKNIDQNYLNSKISSQEFLSLYRRAVNKSIQKNNRASNGFYYEITKGENTIHLLGSIHLANPNLYPIREDIMSDFKNSSELILELDAENLQKVAEIIAKNNIRTEGSLEDDLGKDLYNRVEKILKPYGLTDEILQKMTPQSLYNAISLDPNRSAKEAGFGVDFYFLKLANLYGKKINGLESAELQANILKDESLNTEIFIKLIEDIVDEIEKNGFKSSNETLDKMQNAWIKGDIKMLNEIESMSNAEDIDDSIKEYNNSLFGDRDINMAKKLEKVLNAKEKREVFVVIGSYHTTLDKSARAILESNGYKVVRK